MTGRDYWRQVLAPLARDGYHRGVVDDQEVVLVNEEGAEVHLRRPSAGWLPASLVVPAVGPDDVDPEIRRGIRYLMTIGSDRMELQV